MQNASAGTASLAADAEGSSPSRLAASSALFEWLKHGGPTPVRKPRAADAPPLVHLSDAFEIVGTEGNITLVAKRAVQTHHFICGVALTSVLHPRTEAVAPARREVAARLAERVRKWRTGGEGLLGEADDAYRIDMIMLLALELLDMANSPFKAYLESLPSTADAAPPSLWPYLSASPGYDPAAGAAALSVLSDTSISSLLAVDDMELAPLLKQPHGEGDDASRAGQAVLEGLAEAVPGATVPHARACLLRALALVTSRMISGIGLVPLLDLCNGAIRDGGSGSGGGHNATIERTQLAVSHEAAEAAPCVAALSSRRIEAGEQVLLAYGSYSAARFLWTYGYIGGGPDLGKEATSPHDATCVIPRSLWPALTPTQRTVLQKYGITAQKLGIEDDARPAGADVTSDVTSRHRPTASPFRLPVAEASAGKTTPMMRQVGLIACIKDESTLLEIAKTGKLGTTHGVGAADIARQVVAWCTAHAEGLACASLAADVVASAGRSGLAAAHLRMALRVAHGERAGLLAWMAALQEKHSAAIDGKEIEAVKERHAKCLKKLKRAIKDAASGGAAATDDRHSAAVSVD